MNIILLAPGQGTQKPGMLQSLMNDQNKELLQHWSELIDIDLTHMGTSAPLETISDTSIAQPLIVAAGLLTAPKAHYDMLAGHSIGEITITALSEVITYDEAIILAAKRGEAMKKACSLEQTGMTAIIGKSENLETIIKQYDLHIAAHNLPNQTVIAGLTQNLKALQKDPIPNTRMIPLQVDGAFHTSYMNDAVHDIQEYLSTLKPKDPIKPLLSNKNGEITREAKNVLDNLLYQVTHPVHWIDCMSTINSNNITHSIELSPSGTLTNFIRKQYSHIITNKI